MNRTGQGLILLYAILFWALAAGAQSLNGLTLRELLIRANSPDTGLLSSSCLDTKAPTLERNYVGIACLFSPAAVETFIFSRDGRLAGELYGWELAYLPNDFIIYRDSDVASDPTHPLGISIFNPATGADKKIYPPVPPDPIRQAFINRVAALYKNRGKDGNPELFDSVLVDKVSVDAAHKSISFVVQYGDPQSTNDPLPFKEIVSVICAPFDSVTGLHCSETSKSR